MILIKYKLTCLLFLISVCLFFSCKKDKPSNSTIEEMPSLELVGKWDMVTAYKGDKESKMLNKGYFTFDSLGQFSTNILGDNKSYPYKQTGDKIVVKNPNKSIYNVISKTPDTLVLSAKLRNFNFKFITSKSSN